jgi:hypothetical protein
MRSLYTHVCRPVRHLRLILLALVSLAALPTLAQTIRYVSTTGTNPFGATATSWATSTTDLQGAINASASGDQVWVKAGVYQPGQNSSFSMKAGVAIIGGFVGNEMVLSGRPAINPVSGSPSSSTLAGNGSRIITNDNNGLTTTAVLDGFVLTGGNVNGIFDPGGNSVIGMGGAIYNNSSSPLLTNCSFQNNTVNGPFGSGGAIYNNNSSPVLTNCSFQNNSRNITQPVDGGGGAIYNSGGSPVLTNCSFQSNQATGLTGSGGAICNTNSSPLLTNCTFQRNTALYGGAIYNVNGNPALTNCSFQGNTAIKQAVGGGFGGAIYNYISSPLLTNCSFQSNQAAYGGAIANTSSSVVLTNSVLWGNGGGSTIYNDNPNSVSASYSYFDDTVVGYTSGPGNLTTIASPFVSANSVALPACSPAIDAGNSASYAAATSFTTDITGNPRIVGNSIDMGAVELQGTAIPTPTRFYVSASSTAPNGGDGQSWATAFKDLQSALSYPCTQRLTEIWVAKGVYQPAAGQSFSMLPNVKIIGGFVGSETVLSGRPAINPITGSPSSSTLLGNGNRIITNDNNGLTTTAVLDGFVLTGGNANASSGGAIYNKSSSPLLTNCSFQSNTATGQDTAPVYGGGGAIYNDSSSPLLTNCSFQSNQAFNGGAIYNNNSSSPLLTNCSFQSNTATGLNTATQQYSSGGAIYNSHSSAVLTNCSFQSNQATGGYGSGGAIYNFYGSVALTNCRLQSNQAYAGGAIGNGSNSGATLTNCIVQGNRATQGGVFINYFSSLVLTNCSLQSNQADFGGAINNSYSTVVLTNSVLWGNGGANTINTDRTSSVSASYSLFDNTVTGYDNGVGNLTTTASPFVSANSVALPACSPAIDAGNSASYAAVTSFTTDITGNPRIVGNSIDMGAVELQGTPPALHAVVCVGQQHGPQRGRWAKLGNGLQRPAKRPQLPLYATPDRDLGG